MDSKSDIKVDDSKAAEVGIIVHNGREFAAMGFTVDVESKRMVAYVSEKAVSADGKSTQSFLTTWEGQELCRLIWTGYARGFYRTRLNCYYTAKPIAGYYWFGRGLGKGMILKLRRGRKAK